MNRAGAQHEQKHSMEINELNKKRQGKAQLCRRPEREQEGAEQDKYKALGHTNPTTADT